MVQGQPLEARQVLALHLVFCLLWPGNSALRYGIYAKRNMRQAGEYVGISAEDRRSLETTDIYHEHEV